MTSAELKSEKATFITNVNNYLEKYNGLLAKVKEVGNDLSGYEDTILKNEIVAKNDALLVSIKNLITKVEGEKESIIAKVDNEIARLEAQELAARKKKEEEATEEEQ